MTHEVRAFLRCEEADRGADEIDHLVEVPRSGGAEERFQFGEGELDRIEVRTVRRQKPQLRADLFDRRLHRWLFVYDQVIEHDDVARPERRHQDLLDVGQKGGIVDRPIEHSGRVEAIPPERGDDGVGLPVTARRVVAQAEAPRTPPVAPQEIGGDAGLVEEDVLARVVDRLPVLPAAARRGDVRASLFVGVYRFF